MNNFIENASRFDVSTGFHYDAGENLYNFNQHFGHCNAIVEDQDLKAAAIFIVNMLNEQNKVKE